MDNVFKSFVSTGRVFKSLQYLETSGVQESHLEPFVVLTAAAKIGVGIVLSSPIVLVYVCNRLKGFLVKPELQASCSFAVVAIEVGAFYFDGQIKPLSSIDILLR